MDASKLLHLIQETPRFIRSHYYLNATIRFLLLSAALTLLYRLLMSRWGRPLRQKIAPLAQWHASREVSSFVKAGEFAQAGERLLELGEADEAARVFQQGQLYGRAADVRLAHRQFEKAAALYDRAGDSRKAASIYLDQKKFELAQTVLEKADHLDWLAELLLERGESARAAVVLGRLGRGEESGNLFLSSSLPHDAAKAFAGEYQRLSQDEGARSPHAVEVGLLAAKAWETANEPRRAAEIYLAMERWPDAAKALATAGEAARAAELYERIGDLEKAALLLRRGGDSAMATRLEGERLSQEGKLLDAVVKFQEVGDFHRAAEIYSDLDQPDRAAAMYERAGEHGLAASKYREAGLHAQAAAAFETAGDFREAATSFRAVGNVTKEIASLGHLSDYLTMAETLQRRGDIDAAIATLDRVEPESPHYRAALTMKGKLWFEQGEVSKARDLLLRASDLIVEVDSGDVDMLYHLAIASERLEVDSPAVDLLERFLAENRVDPSALGKAQNVLRILNERASSRMSRLFSQMTEAKNAPQVSGTDTTAPKSKRYSILKEIGRGGMGVVYTARDTTLDRTVALKVLPEVFKTNPQAVRTFLREAKAAASLNHPNIVTVYDSGNQDGDYFIAMEVIDGQTLKEILRARKKLTYASVYEVLRQLLSALAYAHSQSVVHRDLTTSNIMWTRQKTVKIMDFGLAKVIKELMSEQSIIGGTPSYMSPEQTVGDPVDHRTDIYSLGICIYEMSLGELPFASGDLGYHHVHTPPPSPKLKDPNLPDVLQKIILRCLEKTAEKRFQSIGEIQTLLAAEGPK